MSDNEWDFDFEEDNEGDGTSASQEDFKPPQLLVGIDTHPTMFTKTEEGIHAFHSCLLGIYTVVDQLLLKADKRTIAVIFAHNLENKALLFNFDTLAKEKLALIKKILDMSDENLKEEYMR